MYGFVALFEIVKYLLMKSALWFLVLFFDRDRVIVDAATNAASKLRRKDRTIYFKNYFDKSHKCEQE